VNVARYTIFVAIALVLASPVSAIAGCLLWETRCTYECIEYYPNGTDCKKTKKTCERVCANDTYDVDHGGIDDTNRGSKPPASRATVRAESTVQAESTTTTAPEVAVTGRLEHTKIERHDVWLVLPSQPISSAGDVVEAYEIDGEHVSMKSFENLVVRITGRLSWIKTADNGYRPLFVAQSIHAVKR